MKKELLTLVFLFLSAIVFAQNANNILVDDTRNANDQPSTYQNQVRFEFKYRNIVGVPGSGNYSGLMTFAPWSDISGDKAHQLNFNNEGIYYRNGWQNANWESWSKIVMQNSDGKIGIGVSNPAGTISFPEVSNGVEPVGITWYSGGNDPTFYGIHRTSGTWIGPNYQQLRLGFQTGIVIDPGTDYGKSYLDVQGNGIRVTSGSVGIGTIDTKTYKLAVNGSAIFTKAVVKNYGNWPDYVFDSSYQLPSLDSVSTFIQANKHLPDMPSAATVEKDGHDLGEVQKLLLKKMEELTLYIIEMKKENAEKYEALRKENEALKVKIETIQSKK